MKFFKQTKETKRKISFFMALAMVISLLPVSPVAKAVTTEKVTDCNVYVNLDEKSEEYVKVAKVITGGAIDDKEATTASVIVAPINEFIIKDVEPEKAGFVEVTANKAVTLGSISLTKGSVTTSAAVVVREKTDNTGNANVAVSSSSLGDGIIAKASLVATGPVITGTSKSITGAVISIDGIAADKNIEVAIVMEDGKTVTDDVNVTFAGTLKGAICTADGQEITINETIKAAKNSEIALKIEPEDNKEFVKNPTVTVNEVDIKGTVTNGIYTSTIIIGETDATVTINAEAVANTENGIKVTYSGTVSNADIAVSLSGEEFVSGSNVKATDTLDITITPKSGYYFADGKLPKVTLEDTTSAKLTETGVTGNAYKASVSSFKKSTVITISGAAEEAKVKNETNSKDNVGAATLDTESLQAVETDIKNAFKESDKVTAASATAVTEALADKGTIGVALSVTNAGINETDAEKGKNAIDSKDKKAKDRAVALDISLTAICRDKNGNEVARVEVNELTKEVKISIAAKGIFGDSFSETPAANCTRKYFVIRVHDGKTEKIECKLVKGNIEFSSKLFSTYVFYYEDVENNQGGNGGGSTGGGSGIGSYVPSGTSTPAPSATPSATPDASATPSASVEPSTTPSASPSDTDGIAPGASSKPDATKAPAGNDKDDNTGGSTVKVKVGKKVTVNSSKYKVTSVSGTRAVQFTSSKKNAKNVVIPATVKISGKNYKVTSIANNAFKNNKKLKKVTIGVNVNKIGKAAFKGCKNLKSIIIKTKKLTAKKVGANAFKGINKKATFKVPKKKVKAYKKIVKAKGAAKTVKVKK